MAGSLCFTGAATETSEVKYLVQSPRSTVRTRVDSETFLLLPPCSGAGAPGCPACPSLLAREAFLHFPPWCRQGCPLLLEARSWAVARFVSPMRLCRPSQQAFTEHLLCAGPGDPQGSPHTHSALSPRSPGSSCPRLRRHLHAVDSRQFQLSGSRR